MQDKMKTKISTATIVAPTGVDRRIETRIPSDALVTEIIPLQIITDLKFLKILMAERAGKTTSAEIKREPTRFIASTIIIDVITAITRL